jgi:drug/metabolite transporter (DMT)-like permease
MDRLTKGYLIAIVGVLFWSVTGILISRLTGRYAMSPLLLAFWRDLLVCVALVPTLFIVRRTLLRLAKEQLRFFLFFGLILATFNSIWTYSVKLNGAAVATVLGYGSAGFTALLAWWLFRERLGLPKIVAVVCSLGGCVLVADAFDPGMWRLNPLAISVGLLSGLFFALYSLMGKEAVRRGINPWSSLLFSFCFAAGFLFLYNLVPVLSPTAGSMSSLWPSLPAGGWLELILLAFLPTILGFGLYITSMNYLPASIANLLATLEPVMTAVWAYLLLGERLTGLQIFGSGLVLAAMLIVRLGEGRGENRTGLSRAA